MVSGIISAILEEIKKVIPNTYNQLPMIGVGYPFAVVEEVITSKKPMFQSQIIIDIWNNKLNNDLIELDQLATNLYNLSTVKTDVFLFGTWEVIQNVATSEEGLTRKQIRLNLKGSHTNGF